MKKLAAPATAVLALVAVAAAVLPLRHGAAVPLAAGPPATITTPGSLGSADQLDEPDTHERPLAPLAGLLASPVPAPPPTPPAPPATHAEPALDLAPVAEDPPEPGEEAPGPTGTGTWVLAVGIDDYPGTSRDLQAGASDARQAVDALAQGGAPAGQTLTLTDGDATADGIRNGIAWLTANAGPEAVAVVVYSGHVRSNGGDRQAIVAADDGLIRDAELATLLEPLQAVATWIVVAGCYAGGFTELVAPGRILTAASPADQISYERGGASDLIRYLVIEAWLERRAGPSVQEAFAHADARSREEVPDTIPVQFDELGWPLVIGPRH